MRGLEGGSEKWGEQETESSVALWGFQGAMLESLCLSVLSGYNVNFNCQLDTS